MSESTDGLQLAWGCLTIIQAFVTNRGRSLLCRNAERVVKAHSVRSGGLTTTRLLIGAFEAGFYPTAVAYLSCFYRRYDLGVRVGLFYGQYAVAGAFSGAIAYGVFQIHDGALKNWQYLFIIEGTLTCGVAVMAWFWLPVEPGSAWFLSKDEQVFARERIRLDDLDYGKNRDGEAGVEEDRLTRKDVVETVKDWKLWSVLVLNICASVPSTAFSVFLPLVVQGMGYSSIQANLVSSSSLRFGKDVPDHV
jgi:MFS family permease